MSDFRNNTSLPCTDAVVESVNRCAATAAAVGAHATATIQPLLRDIHAHGPFWRVRVDTGNIKRRVGFFSSEEKADDFISALYARFPDEDGDNAWPHLEKTRVTKLEHMAMVCNVDSVSIDDAYSLCEAYVMTETEHPSE